MLPSSYIEELKAIPHFDIEAYLEALRQSPTRGLHLNLTSADLSTAKAAVERELGKDTLTPLGYTKDGFLFQTEKAVGQLPLHHAGAYYMQEPSAMCPVACLPLKKGMRVLDLCAAPGGKSTQIANRIGEEGLLVANEINHSRCSILAGNIERMGIRNAVVTNTDAETFARYFPAYFDAVVVDAPCSGEGMFRKMPESLSDWGADSPAVCAKRQLEILSYAAETVKAGGYVVYSTCTFSKCENEDVVAEFLRTHPDFSILSVPEEVQKVTVSGIEERDLPLSKTRRFYPYLAQGEGQYMALLQKAEEDTKTEPKQKKKKDKKDSQRKPTADEVKEKQVAADFLVECLQKGNTLAAHPFKAGYVLPPSAILQEKQVVFPLPSEHIYAFGVKIGEVRKGRVIPYHHFFTAYGRDFKTKLSLSGQDPLVFSYLKGDVIPCDTGNGWGVILVDGYALGGIKVSLGMAKNHYPTGLRTHN